MRKTLVSAVVAGSLALAPSAWAAVAGGTFTANGRSFQEVPAISSSGMVEFTGTIDEANTTLNYTLNYSGFRGTVSQAHLHFGQMGVNGGIVIFLCTNLNNGPVGTQTCPTSGTITGSATMANVGAGAMSQGIPAGAFNRLTQAIRQGVVYVNVHSDLFPGGEVRGQLRFTPD